MSKIYNLPVTVIKTNGDRDYKLKSSKQQDPLQHVDIESADDSTINIDLSLLTFNSVAIKAESTIGETTLKWVRSSMATQTFETVVDRPLYCDDSLKQEYKTELQFLIGKGYVIEGVVPVGWKGLRFFNNSEEDHVLMTVYRNYAFEYSSDEGKHWYPTRQEVWEGQWESIEIAIMPQTEVWLRGNGFSPLDSASAGIEFPIGGRGSIDMSGNIMSLLDGTGESLAIPQGDVFRFMFNKQTVLRSAELLPEVLSKDCYRYIFYGCTSLNKLTIGAKSWLQMQNDPFMNNPNTQVGELIITNNDLQIGNEPGQLQHATPYGIPTAWVVTRRV